MRAQAAREQAVAVGHLDGGTRPSPPTMAMPRAKQSPQFARSLAVWPTTVAWPVVPRWRRGCGPSALVGTGEQAEGVGVAHVLLHDEGELGEVLEAVQVVGGHARFASNALAVERHVVVGMAHRGAHALELERAQLLAGHRLDLRLIVHVGPSLVCPSTSLGARRALADHGLARRGHRRLFGHHDLGPRPRHHDFGLGRSTGRRTRLRAARCPPGRGRCGCTEMHAAVHRPRRPRRSACPLRPWLSSHSVRLVL